ERVLPGSPPYTGQPPDCAWAVTARTRTTANAMTDERAGLFIESLLDGGDSGTSLPSLFGELRGQCVMRSKSKRETRAGSRTLSSAAGPARPHRAAGPQTRREQRVGQPQPAAAVAEPAVQRAPQRLP